MERTRAELTCPGGYMRCETAFVPARYGDRYRSSCKLRGPSSSLPTKLAIIPCLYRYACGYLRRLMEMGR